MAEEIVVEVVVIDTVSEDTDEQQPKNKGKEDAEKTTANAALGLGKQVAGYLPGVNEAVGTAGRFLGAVQKVGSAPGAAKYVVLAGMVASLSKTVADLVREYGRDRRQSREMQRRAGNFRRGE